MYLKTPRIDALSDAELSAEQAGIFEEFGTRRNNVFRTMVRIPEAARAFLTWGCYVLSRRNSLTRRERELVILRTGWLARSGYEWAQHKAIGLKSDLTEADIEAIKRGSADPAWSEGEKALLDAADDLHARQFIGEDIWTRLKAHYQERQIVDLVFTVSQYMQVSMFLNTFGVQLEEGQVLDPDFDRRER